MSALDQLSRQPPHQSDWPMFLQKKLERLIDRGYCHRRDIDTATMDALEGDWLALAACSCHLQCVCREICFGSLNHQSQSEVHM